MTNDMTARKIPTHRTRDWGNTPILFSLKNVQPLLVAAPPRPEGNVAAPASAAASDSPTPVVQPAPFSLESEGPRVKPKPAAMLGGILKNSIAVTLLVLLVLLVIKISVNDSPMDKSSAQITSTPIAPLSETGSSLTPSETSAAPTLATTSPTVIPPAVPTFVATSTPVEPGNAAAPAAAETTSSTETADVAAVPAVNPPLLLTASNPNSPVVPSVTTGTGIEIPSSDDASAKDASDSAPSFPMQPIREPTFPGRENSGAATTPSPTVHSAGSGLNISVHSTTTPDLPTESVIELWNRANGNSIGIQQASSKQPAPATPVSSSTVSPPLSGSYQPISTGWDFVPPTFPAGTNLPAASGIATPSWDSLNPAGQSVENTPLSGQSYPPKAQEYRPLTVQPTEQPAAPNSGVGTVNRYQSIRQPSVTPTSSTPPAAVPARAPYVPMGNQSISPSTSGATAPNGTSFGYPAIQ